MSYYNCVEPLTARESILAFEKNSYPNLKKSDASKLFNKKQRILKRVIKKEAITFGEIFKKVKGRINGQ